jgi:hypothetical protein
MHLLPLPSSSPSPSLSSNIFSIKPFGGTNTIKDSTSFLSTPAQPSTSLSMQSTGGLNTRTGLIRPM